MLRNVAPGMFVAFERAIQLVWLQDYPINTEAGETHWILQHMNGVRHTVDDKRNQLESDATVNSIAEISTLTYFGCNTPLSFGQL